MPIDKYSMRVNRATPNSGEIVLYGTIGQSWWDMDGVTAAQFQRDLRALGSVETIDLRLNSEGGVITDAQTMYTLLREHPATVNVHIDGFAASAASFLAMVGDTISIAEGGFLMIHNARGGAMGTAPELERAAEVLRSMNDMIARKYMDRSGQPAEKIAQWMDDETWFEGRRAVDLGFATSLVNNMKMAACSRGAMFNMFNHVPVAARLNRQKIGNLLESVRR